MNTTLNKSRAIGIWIAFFILVAAAELYSSTGRNLFVETYRDWFGLNGSSLVSDYRVASSDARAYWLRKMCNDGVCLHRVDWKCGFSNTLHHGDEAESIAFDEKITACFTALAAKAPLAETLGKLRVICGRQLMVFVGDQYSNRKECEEVGGQWGKKLRVYQDESVYARPSP